MPTTRTPPPSDPADEPRRDPGPASAGLSWLTRLEARDVALSGRIATGWPHPRWLTVPLGALSLTGNYGVVWIVLAAVGAATVGGFSWARFLYVAPAVVATEMVTFGVKVLVRRRRPPEREPGPQHIPLPISPSFPSSHASMGSVGFLTMTALYPAWWPAFLALALTLDASRVYLRVHYVADVLVGAALGLAMGLPYIALVHV